MKIDLKELSKAAPSAPACADSAAIAFSNRGGSAGTKTISWADLSAAAKALR